MTPAEKAQYFGLYLEQEVAVYEEAQGLWALSLEFLHDVLFHDIPGYLSLRSIEQITDDELKDISERLGFINTLSITERHMIESRMVSDTLRDMGIATPWKHYSIQDLIDNNVLKLES